MSEEYEKCKICKHACYDEPVVTCNHPVGFGPNGECPIYGDEEEERNCFSDNKNTIDKWTAPKPKKFAWAVVTIAENCKSREDDMCGHGFSRQNPVKCTMENCPLTIKKSFCAGCHKNQAESMGIKSREDHFKNIYDKANNLISVLAAEGKVTTEDNVSCQLLEALAIFDGGEFDTIKMFPERDKSCRCYNFYKGQNGYKFCPDCGRELG